MVLALEKWTSPKSFNQIVGADTLVELQKPALRPAIFRIAVGSPGSNDRGGIFRQLFAVR
jgi:hypothetical protein